MIKKRRKKGCHANIGEREFKAEGTANAKMNTKRPCGWSILDPGKGAINCWEDFM